MMIFWTVLIVIASFGIAVVIPGITTLTTAITISIVTCSVFIRIALGEKAMYAVTSKVIFVSAVLAIGGATIITVAIGAITSLCVSMVATALVVVDF